MLVLIRLLYVPIAVLLASTSLASAMDFVVIAAENSSYAIGAEIAGDDAMTLPADATLVLLAADGSTRDLKGPFQGTLETHDNEGDPRALAVIQRLLSRNVVQTQLLGAVRGTDGAQLPGAEMIAIDRDGHRCLFTDQAYFWRADVQQRSTATLFDATQQTRAELTWPAGVHVASVASAELLGAEDLLVGRPNFRTVYLFMHYAVDAEPMNVTTKAAWLIENGCIGQSLALLVSLY